MFTISKEFAFSASHQLDGLPADHPCARLHGHNYTVEVEVTGSPDDQVGFVLDYHALAGVKRYVDDELDHRHLNQVLPFNPTAELLARHLHNVAGVEIGQELTARGWVAGSWRVAAVRVKETPKTCAEYRP